MENEIGLKILRGEFDGIRLTVEELKIKVRDLELRIASLEDEKTEPLTGSPQD